MSNKKVLQDKRNLIDKFFVPANAEEEFIQRMNYNRKFIKTLPGFIKDDVYEQTGENGNLIIVTIATWENEDAINKAKEAVQAEFKRIGFNPFEFYQRLEIKLERGIYRSLSES